MYHITDLKKFSKCPRYYFLDTGLATSNFQPYLRSDESYLDLLKEKLHISNWFLGRIGDSKEEFLDALSNFEWFAKARFEINELRIKIPLLHKLDNGFDIYFMYYGTDPRDIDFFTYRITVEVLEKQGILVNDIFLVYVNPDYVYHNKIDPDKLFKITNKYKGGRIINQVLDSVVDYDDIINRIDASSLDELAPVKSRVCHLKSVCPYYDICFADEKKLEDDSILTLVSSQYKTKMFEEGICRLKDVDLSMLEGNRVQYAQVMASKNGGLFIDKLNLKKWLEQLDEKPISFIDFEWDRYLIPSYEGMKPLDVIPFEFALYVDDGSSELKHYTFISNGDCRKEFVETLIKSLPKTGKILAYNAQGAEILRLKELSVLYPEYKSELDNIISRFVDLATPFIEGLVYDIRMAGNYTLKKLVTVVSDKSYADLDINEGMSAVFEWRNIDKGVEVDEKKIIDDLKKYCSLDAYSLYLVYIWLKDKIGGVQ